MPRTTTQTANVGATANGMTVSNDSTDAPSTPATGGKGTARPVNPGISPSLFRKVGAELPKEITARKGTSGGVGRTLGEATLGALRYLRENYPEWCIIGEYVNPSPPPPRLTFAGFFKDENGNAVAPTEEEEKTTPPDGFPIKRKIAYKYGKVDADGNYDPEAKYTSLFLRLTDEDWQPPKKREQKPTGAPVAEEAPESAQEDASDEG